MEQIAPTIQGPDFRPLYAQVRDLLIRRMVDRVWKPGQILPSENRLAAELGVSQGTVRKALDELAAQNLVIRKQGRGTFVAQHSPQHSLFHFFHIVDAKGNKELPHSRILDIRLARADREQAGRLNLPPRAKVYDIRRLRVLDERPILLEWITLPAALFPDLDLPVDRDLPTELYVLYQQKFGVTVARANEHLTAVAADANDARHLQVAEGTPLIAIDRLAMGLDGNPVEWRVSHFNSADHAYYSIIE